MPIGYRTLPQPCGTSTVSRICLTQRRLYNHRIVAKRLLDERADVYDISVNTYHNFLLASGVFVHNSVDGDPPAAQRYTEARLAPIAEEVLADIDRDTVDFGPNFDGTLQEPLVLPARLPNLLVNGASGIAVGMATNIPPHNVGEVVDALAFIIEKFSSTVDEGVPFDLVWERIHGASIEGEALAAATKALPRPLQATLKERVAAKADAEKAAPRVTPEALGHALLELVDEKADVTPDELMAYIKGPDFPTGGIIVGIDGIKQAYTTGRGRVTVRAKVHTEDMRGNRQALVVGELPYQVNKATLIEKIAELIRDRRIEGISDIRDESDREGMRLVIELKRDVAPRHVMNQLYKFTALQSAFSANMVALVDGQPRVLTLKAALLQYVELPTRGRHRRTQHELNRARQRAHILEGLKIALDNLDAVIATIRASRDAEARARRPDEEVQAHRGPGAGDPRHAAPPPGRARARQDPRRAGRGEEADRTARGPPRPPDQDPPGRLRRAPGAEGRSTAIRAGPRSSNERSRSSPTRT